MRGHGMALREKGTGDVPDLVLGTTLQQALDHATAVLVLHRKQHSLRPVVQLVEDELHLAGPEHHTALLQHMVGVGTLHGLQYPARQPAASRASAHTLPSTLGPDSPEPAAAPAAAPPGVGAAFAASAVRAGVAATQAFI